MIQLTKCFVLISKKQDGTFLKVWKEDGTYRFHMSNNNIQQSTFSQQISSTPDQRTKIFNTSKKLLEISKLTTIYKRWRRRRTKNRRQRTRRMKKKRKNRMKKTSIERM